MPCRLLCYNQSCIKEKKIKPQMQLARAGRDSFLEGKVDLSEVGMVGVVCFS